MCFIKSSTPIIAPAPKVERKLADASLTKNSQDINAIRGYEQNIKTSPMGLEDEPATKKNTLLGD